MVLLALLAEVATASPPVAGAPPEWVNMLHNQFIAGVIVAVITQVFRAIPKIALTSGPKVAAVAAILSVIAGAVAAYANGSLDGFDLGSAWNILVSSVITLTTAMGTAETADHASRLLAVRGPDDVTGIAVEPPAASG